MKLAVAITGIFISLFVVRIKAIKPNETENEIDDDNIVYQKYIEMDKSLKAMTKSAIKSMLPYVLEANEKLNVSSRCSRDLFQLITQLRDLKLSAVSFLDATGKIPEGMLFGRNAFIGDYEECLKASVTHKNGDIAFRGQYCLLAIKPLLPKQKKYHTMLKSDEHFLAAMKNTSELMKHLVKYLPMFYFADLSVGVCVPTGCSADDVNKMVGNLADNLYMSTKVEHCNYEGKYKVFTPRLILAVCILSCLGSLALIGTIVEFFYKRKNNTSKSLGIRLLESFSILTNFPKLISTKSSESTLRCLDGIRSLSLFYIILEHEYFLSGEKMTLAHMLRAFEAMNSFTFHIITNGMLVVDVFFFVGGLLNCYTRVKKNAKTHKSDNFGLLIFHRLWRLYPPLLLATFVFPYIFDQTYGPLSSYIKEEFFGKCDKQWWKNLIFVNAFSENKEVCMPQTWYISVDFHLFLMSLFTIPVFFRSAKKGLILHLGITIVGAILAIVWAWQRKSWPAVLVLKPHLNEKNNYRDTYTSTLPHIAPYFLGILVGYFLYVKKELKIPKGIQVIGWITAGTLSISMLFTPYIWNQGKEYTALESCLYFALSRPAYVLGIAWMVICCVTGHGGIINYLLTLKIWIPIARLSFMAYLVSPAIQAFYVGNSQVVTDYHNMIFIWRHFGDIMVTLLISIVLVLLAESPFIAIEKIILGRRTNQDTELTAKGIDNHVFQNSNDSNMIHGNNFRNIEDSVKL